MKRSPSDLEFIKALDSPTETLEVEFKESLDLMNEPGISKLAKEICALLHIRIALGH